MRALVVGAAGELAGAIAESLLARNWHVDLATREVKASSVARRFKRPVAEGRARVSAVQQSYSTLMPQQACEAYFFTQALFDPAPIATMLEEQVHREIEVGLLDIIQLTRKLLQMYPPLAGERTDYCYIGSTSAYAGFADTAVYCAVKHGLLGFIRALNDEYSQTGCRFWLFSMGTMNTEMGRRLTKQDASSFLHPEEIAERIVEAVSSRTNIFEPEVIFRRRTVRFLEK